MKKFYTLLIVLSVVTTLSAQNLVTNGDFELWTGDVPNGYLLLQASGTRNDIAFSRAASAGRTGDALKITSVVNGSSFDGSFEITITGITPGKSYDLSCWVKSEDDKVWVRYWDTRFLDTSDATVGSDLDDSGYNPLTYNAWTKYGAFTLVAPANAAKLRINFRVYVQTGFVANTSAILVDDLTVEEVTPTVIEVSNILALRNATDLGKTYKLTSEAVLTAQMPFRNKKFIQDATAAIQIDDNSGIITTVYNLGDGITGLKGTMGVVNGMLQFYPLEDPGAKTSQGNTVTPQVLSIPDFKTNFANYESELIKLEDVSFEAGVVGGTFANGTNYTIANGGQTTVMRTEFFDVFTSTVIPAYANITGVAIEFNGTAQLAPRMVSDIGVATAIDISGADAIKVYPIPVAAVLNIEGIDAFTAIEVRDVTGKVYHASQTGGAWSLTLETSTLPKGIYFIRLTSPAGTVTKKFIKN
jgi:hypothetical protein